MLFLDSAALNMILIKLKRPEMVIITATVMPYSLLDVYSLLLKCLSGYGSYELYLL